MYSTNDVTETQLHRIQIKLLEQGERGDSVEARDGYIPFLKNSGFTSKYEAHIRRITNMYGQHNSAYDPELFAEMPRQDNLVKVWGWFHGNTGFSAMFRWASGRQDAYVILDNPNASDEAKKRQAEQIIAFCAIMTNFLKEKQNVA